MVHTFSIKLIGTLRIPSERVSEKSNAGRSLSKLSVLIRISKKYPKRLQLESNHYGEK